MKLPDGDHILTDGAAWIESGAFAIRIQHIGGSIYVDIYKNGHEGEDPLATAVADENWKHEGEE